MKRILIIAILTVAMLCMSACAGKFVCPMCGQEKGGKAESVTLNGTEFKVCSDCKAKIQSAGGLMGSALDMLGGDLSSMQGLMNGSSLDSLESLMGDLGN